MLLDLSIFPPSYFHAQTLMLFDILAKCLTLARKFLKLAVGGKHEDLNTSDKGFYFFLCILGLSCVGTCGRCFIPLT